MQIYFVVSASCLSGTAGKGAPKTMAERMEGLWPMFNPFSKHVHCYDLFLYLILSLSASRI